MMRRNGRAARERGFTLIELVVVMTIIAILAGAVMMQINGRVKQAYRARAVLDIKTFETAIDIYAADTGQPPSQQQGLQALRTKPSSPPLPRNWSGPYLKKAVPKDPWGNDYVYTRSGDSDEYEIKSYAADGQPGGSSEWDQDVTNAGEEGK